MDAAARRYASHHVPRYTSYPTAADFTPMVTAREHATWLGGLDAEASVSIYLHVPYCREICLYCGCNTKMAVRDDVVASYRRALEAEIALVSGLVRKRLRTARLHWGGGTPSILGPDGLQSVLTALWDRFSFESVSSTRSGVLLYSGDAIERIARVDRVIFDKTGTLTLPELDVANAANIPADVFDLAGRVALASRHPVAAAVARAAATKSPLPGIEEEPGQGVHGLLDARARPRVYRPDGLSLVAQERPVRRSGRRGLAGDRRR